VKPYGNLSGKSGVVAYAIGEDCVDVKFRNNDEVYRYSHRSAGKEAVDAMKRFAAAGRGLSTFISQKQPAYER
jgi:hypothetical protein